MGSCIAWTICRGADQTEYEGSMTILPKLRDIVDEANIRGDALTLISDLGDLRHEIRLITSETDAADALRLLTFNRDQNDETPAGSALGSCGHAVDNG
jgi:hypothetical protein